MISNVLISLNEVKTRLQGRLLQRAEYPALLIVDKAAAQLGEVLALLQPQSATAPAHGVGEAAGRPANDANEAKPREIAAEDESMRPSVAADKPADPGSDFAPCEARPSDRPAETLIALDELAGLPPCFERCEDGAEDADVSIRAAMEEAVETDAMDPIRSAAEDAAPAAIAEAPASRNYLPYFAALRVAQNSRY